MKEYIVIICLLLILAGIVWNYNAGNIGGTNCIIAGIVGIGVASLFRNYDQSVENENKK